MSTSSPSIDGRQRMGRTSVGRIYAAASRLSCGLLPNTNTQQPQRENPPRIMSMEEIQTFSTLPTTLNIPNGPIHQQQLDSDIMSKADEPLVMEDIVNSASTTFDTVPETAPAQMEQWLIDMEGASDTVLHPEPAYCGFHAPTRQDFVGREPMPVNPPLPPPPPSQVIPPMPPLPPMTPAPVVQRVPVCMVCQEAKDTEESKFLYTCTKCYASDICTPCLKEWFLDACRNEAKMPARCSCSPIPVTVMSKVLSPEQIKLYSAKYEESQTADRLYCPVPTCSTFIPPRLFMAPKAITSEVISLQLPQITQLNDQGPTKPSFVTSLSLLGPAERKPLVSCPECQVSVCTKCGAFEHIDDCSGDLDPELAELLKKWRIKRCPRCRTGLRKVYGCSHVECRCGAHFCWQCLKPYSICNQSCPDEDDEEESVEDDDLDGQAGFYEGDDHDFGDEPDEGIGGAWGCHHKYGPMEAPDTPLGPDEQLECSRCFRVVFIQSPKSDVEVDQRTDEVKYADGDIPKPSTASRYEQMTAETEPHSPISWYCYGQHFFCPCEQDVAAPHKVNMLDPARLYRCDCGRHVCWQCNNDEVASKWPAILQARKEKVEREASMAWECYCDSVLCGSCKIFADLEQKERDEIEAAQPRYMP